MHKEGFDIDFGNADLRVRRTYVSLLDALMRLIERQPYESITVSELCDEAMIRRTTFYKHFQDKDELALFVVRCTRDAFERRSEVGPADSLEDFVLGMLGQLVRFLDEHDRLVQSLLESSMLPQVIDMLSQQMAEDIARAFEARPPAAGDISPRVRANYYAGGMVGALRDWLKSGRTDLSEDEVLAQVGTLVHATL